MGEKRKKRGRSNSSIPRKQWRNRRKEDGRRGGDATVAYLGSNGEIGEIMIVMSKWQK